MLEKLTQCMCLVEVNTRMIIRCGLKNGIPTNVWSLNKELPMRLKIWPEEDTRCHRPGWTLVWVQDSLLRDSIGQKENHHDEKEIDQIHCLRNVI